MAEELYFMDSPELFAKGGQAIPESTRQFLLENIKKIAKEKNYEVSGDFILLYHGTSPANHKKILESGKFKANTWFAADYETARRYGNMIVKRGEPVVTSARIYMGSLYYNGYFSTNEDLYFINGVYQPKGMRLMRDGGWLQNPEKDDYGKPIVYKDEQLRIAVNDIDKATYVTAWHNGKKVGSLQLGNSRVSETKHYMQINNVEVLPQYRGRGIGKKLYQAALKYSDRSKKGIASEYEQRTNKKQVPQILKKIGGRQTEAGHILVDRFSAGGKTNSKKSSMDAINQIVVKGERILLYKEDFNQDGTIKDDALLQIASLIAYKVNDDFIARHYGEQLHKLKPYHLENLRDHYKKELFQQYKDQENDRLNFEKIKYAGMSNNDIMQEIEGREFDLFEENDSEEEIIRKYHAYNVSESRRQSIYPYKLITLYIFSKSKDHEFAAGGITGSKFSYADFVEILKDSDETDFNGKPDYKKGTKGYVKAIKIVDGKYLYTLSGMGFGIGILPLENVKEEDLKLANEEKKQEVEKYLDKKQEKKEFKDIGKRVSGSKKEQRAYNMITLADLADLELDEITAAKLVTKDKVFPEFNIQEQRDAGVTSGAAYLKVKLREACGSKPPNKPDKRMSFVKFITFLNEAIKPLKTVEEVYAFLDSFRNYKMKPVDVLRYFFEGFEEVSDEAEERARILWVKTFGSADPYYVFKKAVAEVFGKRFENFIYMTSDSAKEDLSQAKRYQFVTAEQEKENRDKWVSRHQKMIEVNIEKKSQYEKANDRELDILMSDWNNARKLYKKNYEEFRKFAISYYERRINDANKALLDFPDHQKERPDDWSWFEAPKERKEVVKSGEPKINSWPPLHYIKRTGGLVIKDDFIKEAMNADPDKNPITRDFGFKSVQFGNALKSSEAREHIRHFLGAVTDLAEILDINIKDLNNIGGLSMAFAARGGGGRAAATYERGRCIINLTNSNGDGSLAHEIGHYIDNAITMAGKNSTSLNYGSDYKKLISRYTRQETIESYITGKKTTDAMVELMDFIYKGKEGVTPKINVYYHAAKVGGLFYYKGKPYELTKVPVYFDEIEKKFLPVEKKETVQATINYLWTRTKMVSDPFYRDPVAQAKLIGYVIGLFDLPGLSIPYRMINTSAYYFYSQQMQSKYWIEPWELFARAWETYIFDKLAKQNRSSNYLVSGTYFTEAILFSNGGFGCVYPVDKEREYLFTLYEKLIQAIKDDFNLSGFKAFTNIREDEYKSLEEDKEFGGELYEDGGITNFSKVASASSRFKPHETIIFEKPLVGPNGNKLISYTWAYEWTMRPNYEGELVSKRISDWTQAEVSAETGRDIVHQFTVERKDGVIVTVSSETIPSILGYVDSKQIANLPSLTSAVKTLAKQRMQLAILKAQKEEYDKIKEEIEKENKPDIKIASHNDLPFVTKRLIDSGRLNPKDFTYFKMGDEIYKQEGNSKIPNNETIEQLTHSWVKKRVEERGGKWPTGLYDLQRRIERQEKKVKQITGSEISIKDKFESGGLIENDSKKVTVWSRTGRGITMQPWAKEMDYESREALPYELRIRTEGESFEKGNFQYAWFKHDNDPNQKRKDRLNKIVYDTFIVMLNDLKKQSFTEDEFEYWWNSTRISDDEKEYVRERLRQEGKIKNSFATGGSTFKKKVLAISKKFKGQPVPFKYQSEYGNRYDAAEAKEAAQRIVGSMVKSEKMEGGGDLSQQKPIIVNYENAIKATHNISLNDLPEGVDEQSREARSQLIRKRENTPPKFREQKIGTYAIDRFGEVYQLQELPIDELITKNEGTQRKETVDKYAEWQRKTGKIMPVSGVENYAVYNGRVVITDGQHRVLAAKQNDKKTIPVWVALTDPSNHARPLLEKDIEKHFKENSLKVKSSLGKDYFIIAYHGTSGDFTEFENYRIGSITGVSNFGRGFYFTEIKSDAAAYAEMAAKYSGNKKNIKRVIQAKIYFKNPLIVHSDLEYRNIVNAEKNRRSINRYEADKLLSKDNNTILKEMGYDGIILELNGKKKEIIVFDKSQIEVTNFFDEDNAKMDKGGEVLNDLNPTGHIFENYSSFEIDKLHLGENITTYDKTAGISPETKITVYRGVPGFVSSINSGDFVTTNKQLAKDYAGTGIVISKKVRADEILDDITEPLGEEYILREKTKSEKDIIVNKNPSSYKAFEQGGEVKRYVNFSDLSDDERADITDQIYNNSDYLKKQYNPNTFREYLEGEVGFKIPVVELDVKSANEKVNDKWIISENNLKKVRKYKELHPVISNNGEFYDGGHRVRIANERGIKKIDAYEIGHLLNWDWKGFDNNEALPEYTFSRFKISEPQPKSEQGSVGNVPIGFSGIDGNKIVDLNGNPLVVYHGTPELFNDFDINQAGNSTDSGMWGKGIYFTDDKKEAERYATRNGRQGRIIKAIISIKNPYLINSKSDIPEIKIPKETIDDLRNAATNYSLAFTKKLQEWGYDGVIDNLSANKQYVVFHPSQIKIINSLSQNFEKMAKGGKAVDTKDKYLYHGTGEAAFRRIREEGLVPKDDKHLYFSNTELYAKSYAQRKGNPFGNRILRVKKTDSYLADENTTGGDFKIKNKINPNDIELKHNGKWIPIQEYSDESIGIIPIKKEVEKYIFKKGGFLNYYGHTFTHYNKPVKAPKGDKHKMMVLVKKGDEVKLVKFGLRGMEDYTQHKDKKRKENYLSRSAGINDGDGNPTKSDPFSANYWARRILWDSKEPILSIIPVND